ncbi:MAG TPA: alpha/beta hydrolase, partial [Phycisphaerae bacterium]|nr:alpha/beta hydrolase [Phycisphaerae bacterium]
SKELTLMPRPKETSDKYELIYDSCKVKDWNVRTYVTKPKGEGKHPAVLFLFSPTPQPMEFPPQFGDHPYKKVIEALDAAGIATLRVDRVGVGDSEGGDPIQTTYETDVETYRSALKCLAKYDFVDPERVFIFGQGLGSALVPLVGQQPGIRGIVTYGSTVVRPFSEGMVDLFRRIWDLETVEAPEIEKRAKALAEFLAKAGKPDSNPGELLNDYPALGPIRESLVPQNGRSLLGMPIPYFQAIAANDLAAEWSRVSAPVLSLWGTSDYQAGRRDAELIAASAGSKVKGRGEFKMVDSVDHAMNLAEDQEDSYLSGYEGGEYSDAVAKELIAFIEKHDRKAA